MEKYESKQQRIRRPAAQIYSVLSDFTNFTPILRDKVDDWHANENSCSFKFQGMTMKLLIVDKEPDKLIKFTGGDGVPMDVTIWIQLKEVAPYDTRMRIVVHAKLNMMMRMMLGSKLSKGVDQMAEVIAAAFNGVMPAGFDPEKFAEAGIDPNLFKQSGYGQDNISLNDLPEEYKDYYPFTFPDPNKPAS